MRRIACKLGRRGHAVAHAHQALDRRIHRVNVPAAVEDREAERAIRRVHLLGTDHKRHVGQAGANVGAGHVEGGRRAGACVLDVDDRGVPQCQRQQRDLAANRMLALHHPLRRVGEEDRIDQADIAAAVVERCVGGLDRKLAHRAVEKLAERRHAHAGYINFGHVQSPSELAGSPLVKTTRATKYFFNVQQFCRTIFLSSTAFTRSDWLLFDEARTP